MCRNLAWFALLFAVRSPVGADVRVQPLVTTGDRVPGHSGVFIGEIHELDQDSRGRVVFIADLEGDVTIEDDSALLRFDDALGIEVLAREGELIAGTDARFASFRSPQIMPGDQVVFHGYLDRQRSGVEAVYLIGDDGVRLVADGFMAVPGRPSEERFRTISAIGAFGDGRAILAAQTAVGSVSGVWLGPPGELTLYAFTGMQVPGMAPGVLFTGSVSLGSMSPEGAFLRGYVDDPVEGSFDDRCLWRYLPDTLDLVLRRGDVLPGMSPGDHVREFRIDRLVEGRYLFRIQLPGCCYRYGLWAGHLDDLHRVVVVDDVAPDGSVFSSPAVARMSRGGEILFSAVMHPASEPDYWSIWRWRPGGELLRIARWGDRPPGVPDGYELVQLGDPLIGPTGRIVYWGLATGDGPLVDALWTGDPDRGIEFGVGTGTRFVDARGQEHTVTRTLNFFQLNENEQLAVSVRLEDGGYAILRVTAACPCAATDVAGADCRVDLADLSAVLARFGDCGGLLPEDTNSNGCVDLADLLRVLAAFGEGCE